MPSTCSIAVVPQGSTHHYWKTIHAGVNKAVKDLKASGVTVQVTWKGPWREGSHEEQIQIVNGFIKSGVQGMVLAPFDKATLVAPVEEAARRGIATLVIDSALDSRQVVSSIGSDNLKAGAVAANRISQLLGGTGRVLLLYEPGAASTTERAQGFEARLKKEYPNMEIISPEQSVGTTRDAARQCSMDMLTRYGNQIDGIVTTNESSTAGMLMALQLMKKAGKVVMVGFDSSDVYLDAMRYGQIHGLVVQDPFLMGDLGVKTMVDHLGGKNVQKRVDTGVTMITPENMDTTNSKRLLHPPLDEYL